MMPEIPAPLNLDDLKAAADFHYLLDTFRDVLVDLGEAEIAAALPWGDRHDPTAEPNDPDRLTQALSIAFRLATLSEENATAQYRRSRESADGPTATSGSWGRILSDLGAAGMEPATIAAQLGRIAVEPVLTAHPTEAKRATVLEQHRELYLLLVSRENQMWTPQEQTEIDTDLRAMLERLWRTGRSSWNGPRSPMSSGMSRTIWLGSSLTWFPAWTAGFVPLGSRWVSTWACWTAQHCPSCASAPGSEGTGMAILSSRPMSPNAHCALSATERLRCSTASCSSSQPISACPT